MLHGTQHAVLRIDCGEFQSDHEIAKLIGAPPGYVGHLDSKPRLSIEALNTVTTDGCDLSSVLFDEIEGIPEIGVTFEGGKSQDAMTHAPSPFGSYGEKLTLHVIDDY